jgi:ubiquinone biosynthesis protein
LPFARSHFKRTFKHLRRYRHIIAVLTKYGLEEAAETISKRYRIGKADTAAAQTDENVRQHSRAVRFRLALEELGPTFIKFGQLLSTRPDLIPADYVHELEHLQDEVAPETSEQIFIDIEQQLGGKLDDIFASFDRRPIAAGSIAQVHRATTRQGNEVVVKARRPGIAETLETECEILEDLAALLKATLFERDTIDPKRIVQEFNEAVSREVDLSAERRNQLRFLRNFKDDPAIHVPQVYEEYCSEGVLTMEYIDGIRPGDAEAVKKAGLDPQIIAHRGADFVLTQIFEMGFFHADPHPGNFFLLPDNVLAPIDFGQVAYLSGDDRMLLKEMVLAVIDNNAAQMVRALQRADMTTTKTQTDELARELELMLGTYHDLPLRDIPISKVIMQTFELMRKHSVQPPAQFALMLKSLMTIESFARRLDPEFNILNNLKPYARRFAFPDMDPRTALHRLRDAVKDARELVSRLPEDINIILNKFRKGDFQLKVHHEHLENLTRTLDKSSNRISFALIIAGLLIGSSMLVSQQGIVLGLVTLQTLGIVGYIAAAIIGLWLLASIIRSRHY